MAANMWKNSLKNVESDNNKILYEILLDFFYSEMVFTFWISLVLNDVSGSRTIIEGLDPEGGIIRNVISLLPIDTALLSKRQWVFVVYCFTFHVVSNGVIVLKNVYCIVLVHSDILTVIRRPRTGKEIELLATTESVFRQVQIFVKHKHKHRMYSAAKNAAPFFMSIFTFYASIVITLWAVLYKVDTCVKIWTENFSDKNWKFVQHKKIVYLQRGAKTFQKSWKPTQNSRPQGDYVKQVSDWQPTNNRRRCMKVFTIATRRPEFGHLSISNQLNFKCYVFEPKQISGNNCHLGQASCKYVNKK